VLINARIAEVRPVEEIVATAIHPNVGIHFGGRCAFAIGQRIFRLEELCRLSRGSSAIIGTVAICELQNIEDAGVGY
jgi:hypothetical protein